MKVELTDSEFNPWEDVQTFQNECINKHGKHGKYGATTVFVGTMRDMNEGSQIKSMLLDHYPEMTLKHLKEIASSAQAKFDILDIMLTHRIGRVYPNDTIVCVAVWSVHRAAAYDANRYIMEDLKSKTPIWKKEELIDSQRWVEKNTPG